MAKFVSLEDAVSLIKDNMSLLIGGFGSYASPEELLEGLAARFADCGHPQKLTVLCGIAPGDKTESREYLKGYNIGLNRLAADGLIDKLITANLTDARAIAYMVADNKIAAYMPPLGVMANLFRASAAGRPGVITRVGLQTFADPRFDGCAFNDRAKSEGSIVELLHLDDQDFLFYKAFRADVCFIRATYADEDGNLSVAKEAVLGSEPEIAVATHNNGGIVIAQVEDIVRNGSIHPKNVRVHGKLVDYVVKAKNPDNHRQCYATPNFRPELSGDIKTVSEAVKPLPLSLRKVLARRGAMELKPGIIINLGSGIPSGIGSVAAEEGFAALTTTVEAGPMGGVVQEGLSFPGVANPDAIFNLADTLDMYDGGMLDMAFLGFAEIDQFGNVNVSKFAGRCIGAGGFINISQNAKKVFFLGNFSAGKADISITGSGLNIIRDGSGTKFVKNVQQITFSGDFALKTGQEILYITERAVFRLEQHGLVLIEVADGININDDIIAKMEFQPIISDDLRTMDHRLFNSNIMGLNT